MLLLGSLSAVRPHLSCQGPGMLISAVAVNKRVALGACFRFCFVCLFTRVDDQALVKRECGTSPRRTCQRLVPGLLVLLLGLRVCLLVLLAGLSKRLTGSQRGAWCEATIENGLRVHSLIHSERVVPTLCAALTGALDH